MLARNILSIICLLLLNNTVVAQENRSEIQIGEFELSSTSKVILGEETAKLYENILAVDKEVKWNIFVPEYYDPNSPSGVIIYFSDHYPNQIQSSWKTGTREKNLIWISPIGARYFTEKRKMILGILSLSVLQDKYSIDPTRIYVTGDRSGCQTSSNIAVLYPNIISGAIYNSCEPKTWKKTTKPATLDIMANNHYVFINSNINKNRTDIRRAMNKYNNEGINNTLIKTIGTIEKDIKLNSRQVIDLITFIDNSKIRLLLRSPS